MKAFIKVIQTSHGLKFPMMIRADQIASMCSVVPFLDKFPHIDPNAQTALTTIGSPDIVYVSDSVSELLERIKLASPF